MRKTLVIALMALGVMSCAKEEEFVTARFGYCDYEQGAITKVEGDASIQEAINSSLPTDIVLDLRSERTDAHYTAGIGEEVQVPVGNYVVTGGNAGATFARIKNNEISTVPKISINENVEVLSSVSNYPLRATFNCFAIVIDYNELDSITIDGEPVQMHKNGNYGVVFVNKLSSGMKVVAIPKGGSPNEEKSFYFSNQNVSGYVYCQTGYYYLIHPKMVQLMGMVFGLDVNPLVGQDVK